MQICFYNVCDFKVDQAGLEEYLLRHRHNTDVFCFQEAYDHTREFSRKKLPEFEHIFTSKHHLTHGHFNQATLVKNDIEVLEHRDILKDLEDGGSVLYTKIKHGDKKYCILNFYGIYKPGPKQDSELRLVQSAKTLEFIKTLSDPVIMGGDFNLLPDTASVLMFEGYGLKNLIKEYDIKSTRNQVSLKKYPNNHIYFSDYVFVSPKLKIKNFYVPYNEHSDHLPMFVEI